MRLSSVCTIEYSRFWIFYECSKFFFKGMDSKANKNQAFVMYWSCIKRMVQTKHLCWSHTTFVSFCFFLFLLSFIFFFWHKRVGQVRGIRVFISSNYILLLVLCPLVTVLVSKCFCFRHLLATPDIGTRTNLFFQQPNTLLEIFITL